MAYTAVTREVVSNLDASNGWRQMFGAGELLRVKQMQNFVAELPIDAMGRYFMISCT